MNMHAKSHVDWLNFLMIACNFYVNFSNNLLWYWWFLSLCFSLFIYLSFFLPNFLSLFYSLSFSSSLSHYMHPSTKCSPLSMWHWYLPFFLPPARTQPIIVNATADMLREHILPVAQKLREQARAMEAEEEAYNAEKRRHAGREVGEAESTIQEVRKRHLIQIVFFFYLPQDLGYDKNSNFAWH